MNRDELLKAIRTLSGMRKYDQVISLLATPPYGSIVREELDLALSLAAAWMYTFENELAKELLLSIEGEVVLSGNGSFIRRWQNLLAMQLIHDGELASAEALLQYCLVSAERAEHLRLISYATNGLGIVASIRGDVDSAVCLYGRAATVARLLGDRHGVGMARYNLGLVQREWGRLEKALVNFISAAEYFDYEGIVEERIYTSAERAILYSLLGDQVLALKMARKSVDQARALKNLYLLGSALKILGAILAQVGDLGGARNYLEEAERAVGATKSRLLQAELYEEIGILELLEGNIEKSHRCLDQAVKLYIQLGSIRHSRRVVIRFESVSERSTSYSAT